MRRVIVLAVAIAAVVTAVAGVSMNEAHARYCYKTQGGQIRCI